MTTFTTPLNQIESLYVGYFGRAGDPAGVNYWIIQLNAGTMTLAAIARSFAVQPEATAKYPYLANPNISDPDIFVDQVYQNMFNHPADAAGKAYWVAQLNAATGNPATVGAMILNITSGATGVDDTTIKNKVDIAADFTAKAANAGTTWNASANAQSAAEITATNDTAASVTAQKAATDAYIASAPGPQSNFTLDIDTLTANTLNANFNAPMIFNAPTGALVQSLQSGDSAIDTAPPSGPGLSNGGTLTAMLDGLVPLVTLRGIPTHSVTAIGAAGYSGTITGLVTLINNNSLAALTIGAAGNGIDLGGIAGTTTTGRSLLGTVTINNVTAGATTIFVNTAALAGAADALAINVAGTLGTGTTIVGANTVSIKNDTAVAGATDNAYETLSINAAAATNIALADSTSGILSTTKVNFTGAGLTTVWGDAGVATENHFTKITTIDASAQTGGVTLTGGVTAGASFGFLSGAVLTSVKGGTGADSIDLGSMTADQLGAITAGNLDGGTGTARDTLILSTAAGATTVAINNSNFEILGLGGGTLTMDFSKFGAGIDTINLVGAQTAADTFDNLTSGLTFGLGIFHGGFAETFNAAGTGLADTLTVNFTGAAAVGAFATTGFENVTTTVANFAGAVGWAGLNGTATVGATVTHNLINNQTGGLLTIAAENIGSSGTMVITGTGTSGITFTTAPVLGALNAAGYGTGLPATALGVLYSSWATSAQSFLGTAGADLFLGSPAADIVNTGPGDDGVGNMNVGAGGVAQFDQILTGSGIDVVGITGDVASSAIPGAYSTATNWGDMEVGTGAVGTTDYIELASTTAEYAVTFASGYTLQAASAAQGAWTVQSVNSTTTVAITDAANELVKLTSGVVTTGLTLLTAFNAAIGTSLITGAMPDTSYFFTMHDITNSKMILGIVQDHNGATDTIQAGDEVTLIATVNMSAADYANINANHFMVA